MDFNTLKKGKSGPSLISTEISIWLRRGAYVFWGLVAVYILYNSVSYNGSGTILVKQSFPGGGLDLKVGNGFVPQLLGDLYRFDRQISIAFSNKEDENPIAKAFFVRHNDGGTGYWGGTARFNMPATEKIYKILRTFGEQDDVIRDLLIPGMREICTGTAGLLTTEESYTTKRSMISEMCRDQALKGVYYVDISYESKVDEFGKKNRLPVYNIAADPKTKEPKRKYPMFKIFGIDCELFLIPEIEFEGKINGQIKDKMQFQTQLQVTDAQILTAEQKLNEAEATGQKNVTVETMAQRQIKEKVVQQIDATAQSRLLEARGDSVSTVNQLAATNYLVDAAIKEARGQAGRRRKEMQGDQALAKRLEVYGVVIEGWAEAVQTRIDNSPKIATNWDPNYFYNLLQSIDAKVKKDLGLNLSFGGGK